LALLARVLAAVEEAIEGIRIGGAEGGAVAIEEALALGDAASDRRARPEGAEPGRERRPGRERVALRSRLREEGEDARGGADPGPGGDVGDQYSAPPR
jgi:hypothetical protein